MRMLISLVVIVYLVGVGVVLSPTIQSKWNSGTAAELSSPGPPEPTIALQADIRSPNENGDPEGSP